jgi:hypothetical protein
MVSAELRAHFTSGRITVDDFSERLGDALRAETVADLNNTLRDLPPVPGSPRPWAAPVTVPDWDGRRPHRPSLQYVSCFGYRHTPEWAERSARRHLGRYMRVMALLIVIWALTGFGYFWPVWPMVFWGFFVGRRFIRARRYADSHAGSAPGY